jgi:hypothetical protein
VNRRSILETAAPVRCKWTRRAEVGRSDETYGQMQGESESVMDRPGAVDVDMKLTAFKICKCSVS